MLNRLNVFKRGVNLTSLKQEYERVITLILNNYTTHKMWNHESVKLKLKKKHEQCRFLMTHSKNIYTDGGAMLLKII